jgi:hypothetical protein
MVVLKDHGYLAGVGAICSLLLIVSGSVGGRTFTVVSDGVEKPQEYEVTIPEEWKPYLSVGKLTVVGSPFYGVIQPRISMSPLVRINWSLKNLTSETVNLKVNYGSVVTTGVWKTGFGVTYTLKPNEERGIDNIFPVVSAKKPVKFRLHMVKMQVSTGPELIANYNAIMTEPLPISQFVASDFVAKQEPHFVIDSAKLMCSPEQGNMFVVEVTNRTSHELPLAVYVAVGDPNYLDIGVTGRAGRDRSPLGKSIRKIPANNTVDIEVPYSIPGVGPSPLLVFTLFEPSQQWLAGGESDPTSHRIQPFCWGWYDLCRAARSGKVKLPVYVPLEERVKLTAQTRSEHFLFRYRPGSYAEQNIDRISQEREEAYDRLSTLLKMELPQVVTIDLYRDMEAKALDTGTTYTPANTRSNRHIAEVCSRECQCDPYHELAHIFSYHFPNYSSKPRGLVEAFAVYFGPGNMEVDDAKESLKRRMIQGKLKSLGEILLLDIVCEENVVLIDFLLRKDVEKFKKFYVCVGGVKQHEDLEKACQGIYETDLKALERLWHEFISQSTDI